MMARRLAFLMVGLIGALSPARAADAAAEVDFVTRASVGNLFAIAESLLALDRATDPRLKDLARRLLEDHRQAEGDLASAARGSGADPASTLDPPHAIRATALQAKSGEAFDAAFLADQAEMHSNALTLYADYMLLGDNRLLTALAKRMIPPTERQLRGVEALPGR